MIQSDCYYSVRKESYLRKVSEHLFRPHDAERLQTAPLLYGGERRTAAYADGAAWTACTKQQKKGSVNHYQYSEL